MGNITLGLLALRQQTRRMVARGQVLHDDIVIREFLPQPLIQIRNTVILHAGIDHHGILLLTAAAQAEQQRNQQAADDRPFHRYFSL